MKGRVRMKYFRNGILLCLFLLVCGGIFAAQSGKTASIPAGFNTPVGTGKGIYPGRVVWVYNPKAAQWTGSGYFWEAAVNPQGEYDRMASAAVVSLSGGTNAADSWKKLFRWFNKTHKKGNRSYQKGEKIVIKINQNNSTSHTNNNKSNGNPAAILALLKGLVRDAGVPEAMITISDPSRGISDNIYDTVHAVLPM